MLMGTTDEFHNGTVPIILDDIDRTVFLVDPENIFYGHTEDVAQNDPVDAAMTQNGDTAPLLMVGNNFLELRNDSFFQLLKVLSPFDLKSFNIIQPFFERVRKPFFDFPDAQPFPFPEREFAKFCIGDG